MPPGVLALSTDRAQAMVGVFISVTTVPAAGNMALGIATWQASEIIGSAAQLGVNLLGMVLAGTVVLPSSGLLWVRLMARTGRLFGLRRQNSAAQVATRVLAPEPDPLVEPPGRVVVDLDVQPRRRRALLGAPLQERPEHLRSQPLALLPLVDPEVVQPEPVAVQRRLPGGHAVPDINR